MPTADVTVAWRRNALRCVSCLPIVFFGTCRSTAHYKVQGGAVWNEDGVPNYNVQFGGGDVVNFVAW